MQCEFCKKEFVTKGNLKNHQLTAKYCLELRSSTNEKWKCEYCNKTLSSKQNLDQHYSRCLSKNVYNNFREEIELLKNQLHQKHSELHLKDSELKIKEEFYQEQIKKLEEQTKDLQDELKKLAEKAIDRPTTINQYELEFENEFNINKSTNKMIDNRVLNLAPFNLSQEMITKTMEEKFTENHLYNGQKGLAQFCLENILNKDDKQLMKCTDMSRKIFMYLDEKGNLRKDVNAKKLTDIIYEPAINVTSKICKAIPKKYPKENDRLDFAISKKNEIVNIRKDNNEFVKGLIPGLVNTGNMIE